MKLYMVPLAPNPTKVMLYIYYNTFHIVTYFVVLSYYLFRDSN